MLAIHLVIFNDHWTARKWFPFDFPAGYYATVAYWVTSLQSGEWPQWIPYQSMGYPLLMNPQAGFFYPPFWLFVVLRIPFTLHAAVIVQILHVLFGAIGFLLLANELFGSLLAAESGAAAFLLFGGFYTNAEHADIIRGFAWVPWLLWAALQMQRRFRLKHLLLPAVVACFITGAYTGQVIAGLLLLTIFVVVQALQVFKRDRGLFRTILIQFGLIGLGVLLAGAFLLTGAGLAQGLTRSRDVHALRLTFLTGKNLFDFLFPSTLIHPGEDYSMFGMQLPVVLLLFLPLIEPRLLKKLVPFLAIAGIAVLMSFESLARASNVLRHLFPVLALSRFPAADYREFVYLAVLLFATGGIASVLRHRAEIWRNIAGAISVSALFGLVCLTCLQHDVAPASHKTFLDLAKGGLLAMLGTTLLFFLCSRWRKPQIAVFALLPLMVLVTLPVIDSEKQFWADPDLLRNVYDGQGFPLELDGALRTSRIFRRHESVRGPRVIADNHHMLSWWGYIDGAYLTNDAGGVIPLTRSTAEHDPALLHFMLQSSRPLAFPCESKPTVCDGADPVVDLAKGVEAGVPVEYSRNSLSYELDVPLRSLVVENEMAIRGWHIFLDGKELTLKVVDRCLRGWVTPPGRHRVTLRYQTPLLVPGLLLSGAALVGWIATLWLFHHRTGPQKAADDCVILVSSDRTGG